MFKLVMIEGYFEEHKFVKTKREIISTGTHHAMQIKLDTEAGRKYKNEEWHSYKALWGEEWLLRKGKNYCLLTVEKILPVSKHKPALDTVRILQEAEIQRFAQKCVAAYWGIAP